MDILHSATDHARSSFKCTLSFGDVLSQCGSVQTNPDQYTLMDSLGDDVDEEGANTATKTLAGKAFLLI